MKTILKTLARGMLVAALAGGASGAGAFKPEYESYGHTMITRKVLDGGYVFGHRTDGTNYVVPTFSYALDTAPQTARTLSSDATAAVVVGVQSRDWLGSTVNADCSALQYFGSSNPYGKSAIYFGPTANGSEAVFFCISKDLDDPDAHFDNDNFEGSRKSIREHVRLALNYIRSYVVEPDRTSLQARQYQLAARIMLGKALHTIQDFYAHSNWTETRSGGEDLLLLWTNDLLSTANIFTASEAAMFARPAPNKEGTIASMGGGVSSGSICLAQAKPWLTDSWGGNDGNYELLGAHAISTSAWWDSLLDVEFLTGAASDANAESRCDHGVTDKNFSNLPFYKNAGIRKFSGIAKDMPNWPLTPAPQGKFTRTGEPDSEDYSSVGATVWPISVTDARGRAEADATDAFALASFLAAKHSRLFFEKVIEAIRVEVSNPVNADDRIVALFGGDPVPRGQGWVVDRSGTMADVLPTVKNVIRSQLKPGVRYVLIDFNTSVDALGTDGFVGTTGDDTAIRTRLDAMEARGGGGCTRPMWGAVDAALSAMFKGSSLSFFTDASSNDATAKKQAVLNVARDKQIKITPVVSGSCSPIDPGYADIAASTGQTVKVVEHSDAGVAAGASSAATSADPPQLVHHETATLAGSKTISFPGETGVSSLVIAVSGAVTGIQLNQPNGTPAIATISPLLNGQGMTVTSPTAGSWQLILTGNAPYAVSVSVVAPIHFTTVDFKSTLSVGRPGHEYRPQLAATGQTGPVWAKLNVENGIGPAALDLLRLDGSVISTFPLSEMTNDIFEGTANLPAEAHRLRVRGVDATGAAFARIYGAGTMLPPAAPTGQIAAKIGTTVRWRTGIANAFALNLKNLGGDDTVTISMGTAPTGATLNCTPSAIALPGSSEINLLCSMTLPLALDRADFVINFNTPTRAQAMTVPLNPLVLPSVCGLDVNGDGDTTIADALLVTRFLMGYRGDTLVGGVPLGSLRPNAVSVSSFLGSAAQYDIVGRANPSPTALIDGLILTRLMLGLPDSALLNGITIPAGAQHSTAAAIRTNVNSLCRASF